MGIEPSRTGWFLAWYKYNGNTWASGNQTWPSSWAIPELPSGFAGKISIAHCAGIKPSLRHVCQCLLSYENKDHHCASLDGPAGVGSSSHDGGST